jgi:hypothetical protein
VPLGRSVDAVKRRAKTEGARLLGMRRTAYVAKLLGVSARTITSWVNEERDPSTAAKTLLEEKLSIPRESWSTPTRCGRVRDALVEALEQFPKAPLVVVQADSGEARPVSGTSFACKLGVERRRWGEALEIESALEKLQPGHVLLCDYRESRTLGFEIVALRPVRPST